MVQDSTLKGFQAMYDSHMTVMQQLIQWRNWVDYLPTSLCHEIMLNLLQLQRNCHGKAQYLQCLTHNWHKTIEEIVTCVLLQFQAVYIHLLDISCSVRTCMSVKN